MNISALATELIKHHEGVRFIAYQCPALLWTVGVGHLIDASHTRLKIDQRKSLPIPTGWDKTFTMGEVDEILKNDLTHFEFGVCRLAPALINNQGAFDACVSFSFNLGLGNFQRSTLRMKINQHNMLGAADEFLKWNKAGGKVLRGLTNRRNDERSLFLSNYVTQ